MTTCIHNPLAPSDAGLSCSVCGYVWRAPYFLRYQLRLRRQGEEALEAKHAAKEARKMAKPGVVISPKVAAYFTDDVAVIGREWTCEKCHRAPRRHPDFANRWKWKTERGYEQHKCLG